MYEMFQRDSGNMEDDCNQRDPHIYGEQNNRSYLVRDPDTGWNVKCKLIYANDEGNEERVFLVRKHEKQQYRGPKGILNSPSGTRREKIKNMRLIFFPHRPPQWVPVNRLRWERYDYQPVVYPHGPNIASAAAGRNLRRKNKTIKKKYKKNKTK